MQTRVTNSQAVTHKICIVRCFPSRSGILPEAIRIAFTSLQQRPSISLASFLYQWRFPVLICNKSAAEA